MIAIKCKIASCLGYKFFFAHFVIDRFRFAIFVKKDAMRSIEHLQFTISRFDHYYDSINNKGNLFLGVNIFLITGLFAAIAALPTYLKNEGAALFCIALMLSLNIVSLIYTLLSLQPYARTCGSSLVYFGDICQRDLATFQRDFNAQTDDQHMDDLTQQVYYLSRGLQKKFQSLSIAGTLFFVEAVILLPLFFSVIFNLK